MSTLFYPSRETAVIAFFYDHGVDFDLATYEQRALLLDFEAELLSTDPLQSDHLSSLTALPQRLS